MNAAGPLLSIAMTIAMVILGAAFGYDIARPGAPLWFSALLGAVCGFIAAVFVRASVVEIVPPLWRRRSSLVRLSWIVWQAILVAFCAWRGAVAPNPGIPRFLLVPALALFGIALALILTLLWVLIYELFRFTLPTLVRRGAEKVHRRHSL